ncbi:MAG TPA: ATP phosphoribosyltransferase [Pyrinomonadaceae bacterium]
MQELTIAIPKGRLQAPTLERLGRVGIDAPDEALTSRRLWVKDTRERYRFIFVKPVDVPVYVEHGIADCGVVGRDVLLESEADLLQPLDLKIGRCRVVVASHKPELLSNGFGMMRVATKYPRIAAEYFGSRGIPVEIIELAGSVELAPVLGLSDCIVDLVETGRTLDENGLRVVALVAECTARLVVNRASFQLKAGAVSQLIRALGESAEAER